MNSKTSITLNTTEYIKNHPSDFLTVSDLQALLLTKNVNENLCTHPIFISFLGNLLSRFPTLSLTQIDLLLKNIMSISSLGDSISIVFSKENNEKLFTYKLKDDILIYTKQSFIKDTCTTITKYFDKNGNKAMETDTYVEKISEPPSYETDYYEIEIEKEDLTI